MRVLLKNYVNIIEPEDVESRSMGVSGEDILLSPAARRVLNAFIECKNQEKLNVITIFKEHFNKYRTRGLPLLVHTKNHTEVMVTMRWADLLNILQRALPVKGTNEQQEGQTISTDIPASNSNIPGI